jgi:hypothetical protein
MAVALNLALGAQITVRDGDEIPVVVPPVGLTVALPEVVRVVTPVQAYQVRPLAPPRPVPAAGAGANMNAASAPDRTDVRVFLVRAVNRSVGEEAVTFLLADNKSLTLRLRTGAAQEDAFVDLRWARRVSARGQTYPFLASERALMLAMLRDERQLGRKVQSKVLELKDYPELEVTLMRTFEAGDGLLGVVYAMRNRTSSTLLLNQTVLTIGRPNRVVMVQIDHNQLRSCREDSSAEPRGTGCTTLVRVVARADDGLPTLPTLDRRNAVPFVQVAAKEKKP